MYNVVFVYTKEAGHYEGVRWWTSFKNEEDFLQWYSKEDCDKKRVLIIDGIMQKGVTEDEAIELCRQTPLECRLNVIFGEFEERLKKHLII